MHYCYCEAEVRSSSVSVVHVRSTFAHSIFESSPSKEGFHRTHGTPSGSATDLGYSPEPEATKKKKKKKRKNTRLSAPAQLQCSRSGAGDPGNEAILELEATAAPY